MRRHEVTAAVVLKSRRTRRVPIIPRHAVKALELTQQRKGINASRIATTQAGTHSTEHPCPVFSIPALHLLPHRSGFADQLQDQASLDRTPNRV
jgi:hypothetical protein